MLKDALIYAAACVFNLLPPHWIRYAPRAVVEQAFADTSYRRAVYLLEQQLACYRVSSRLHRVVHFDSP
jgi:hypothetical protein